MFGNAPRGSQPDDPLPLLVQALLRDKRQQRRWGVIKIIGWLIAAVWAWVIWSRVGPPVTELSHQPHVAVVQIRGVLGEGESADPNAIATSIRQAFNKPNAKAVFLRMNSPGGSGVAANQLFSVIKRLKTQYPDKPVYAIVGDVCASACYYVASATDQIYANPISMVGSIGVLIDGYGFVGALEKLGIERRLLHAGENKGFMDPFSPLSVAHKTFIQKTLDQVHQQFIQDVKTGRGDRLASADNPDLFSGLTWTGLQARDLGLIDGFGSVREVAEDTLKIRHVVDYTQKESVFDRLASRLGMGFATQITRLWTAATHAPTWEFRAPEHAAGP